MKSTIQSLLRRLSLTFKMVSVCVIIGLSVWIILDIHHTGRVREIFLEKLKAELSRKAVEDRLRLDRYIKLHSQSVRAFVRLKNFDDYVRSVNWSEDDTIEIRYHRSLPPWFPPRSMLRTFVNPRFSLLLDRWGRVREVYISRNEKIPDGLLRPSSLMLLRSRWQSYMTDVDGIPYLLTSSPFYRGDEITAILMFATPIDDEFLIASLGHIIRKGHVTALLTSENPPAILTSSNLRDVPAGTPLKAIKKRYLLIGKAFFDYGASDLTISLASMLSMEEVERLTEEVVSRERQSIAVIAVVFILSFTSLMLFITHRIRLLTHRISEFSEKTLGTPREGVKKGDKLYILEERFRHLTEQVVAAREEIKRAIRREAEEKTRMIVESAFDAIVTIDSEGVINTWNQQAERMFGWKREEALGRHVVDLIVPEEFREALTRGLRNFLLTGRGRLLNQRLEIYALNRDGETFPVELAVSHARTSEGDIFIAVIRDITERRRAEEQIRASLHEKEVLLREIHHRVKNNMQVISSLLRLQSGKLKDPHHMELLNESQNRIKSMALVHEKLYRSRDLAHIDFNEYTRDLVRGLYRAYGINTERIKVEMDIADIRLGVDTAVPCGLIINELVSNALKHAFPDGRCGEVRVGLKRVMLPEGQVEGLELTVSDNGVGIPEGLDIKGTDSLGLRLVTTLTEGQLRGTIELDRAGGTAFRIRFQEIRYEKRI
jgi:PAS domain S-box-containing protein